MHKIEEVSKHYIQLQFHICYAKIKCNVSFLFNDIKIFKHVVEQTFASQKSKFNHSVVVDKTL